VPIGVRGEMIGKHVFIHRVSGIIGTANTSDARHRPPT
jgi:hypothetical protein